MAGYSKTPLPQKLGIKADHSVAVLNAPAGFVASLAPLPDGATVADAVADRATYDIILFFTDARAELERRFAPLARSLTLAGGFWICWPKKASGVATDLTEDVIRAIGLKVGLVDNKVCAIDETWSGLRFVVRLRDRPQKKAKS